MNNSRCLSVTLVCLAVAMLSGEDATPKLDITAPTQAAIPAPIPGALTLNLRSTLMSAMERNRQLRVQSLGPAISATGVDTQKAAFDPVLAASASTGRSSAPGGTIRNADGTPIGRSDNVANNTDSANVNLSQNLPTGTTWALGFTTTRQRSDLYDDPQVTNRTGLTVSQALLKGFGPEANLASVNQARIDARISQYELRGYTIAFVAEVEETYWDHALSIQQVEITERALDIAKQELGRVKEFIAQGKLAEVEIAAAEAEVALRSQYVIDARGARDASRLHLLRLLNPAGDQPLTRSVTLGDQPFVPETALDPVDTYVAVAMRMRADLNQAALQVQRGDLDVVRTRNGLLPQLDLFVNLGRSGYASSFGGAISGDDGRGWDGQVGARFSYALGNRAADAAHLRAQLSREQVDEALGNQRQLAESDVRGAYIEVLRAREQVTATEATHRAQVEKARAEREKFRVGKSTTLLVAQAERDAFSSRIDAVQAVVRNLKALVELYRLDGSLLDRRGIAAPGGKPVTEIEP